MDLSRKRAGNCGRMGPFSVERLKVDPPFVKVGPACGDPAVCMCWGFWTRGDDRSSASSSLSSSLSSSSSHASPPPPPPPTKQHHHHHQHQHHHHRHHAVERGVFVHRAVHRGHELIPQAWRRHARAAVNKSGARARTSASAWAQCRNKARTKLATRARNHHHHHHHHHHLASGRHARASRRGVTIGCIYRN